MSKVIVGMTVSLDGFVNDKSGNVSCLYHDFDELQKSEVTRRYVENTGAIVMGRRFYAMAKDPDVYADDYEYQVPIFVLTHGAPEKLPKQNENLTFTFVTDGVESAVAQAKVAAGDKDVTVFGGARTVRECLKAGIVDEVHLDIMPVLLGGGLRLFEGLMEPLELERVEVTELSARTHLKFRVVKEG